MIRMRRLGRGVLVVLAMLAVALGVLAAKPTAAMASTARYTNLIPTNDDTGDQLGAKQVTFNGYQWYIIADNSESDTKGTVTLLSVGTITNDDRKFDPQNNSYSTSTIKTFWIR